MTRQELVRFAALAALCWTIYGVGLSGRGLVGPDEPRYAAIAHEMAVSGDWVTPRLWGEAWFEKPALLYWMGAAAETIGIEGDLATRIPVALLSFGFLICFYLLIRRSVGVAEADAAALLLATTAGWAAYSQIGVFDLPLAAALGVALAALLPWVKDSQNRRLLPLFGAALGASVLAKGLVGPAIATFAVLPVVRERGLRTVAADLFSRATLLPFAAVVLPWYAACYWANGSVFLSEFLWRHHVLRLVSDELQHVQPWWFYVPVLLVGLAPWTPLLLKALAERPWRSDPQMRFAAAWAGGTVLIFSIATNKLPGYVLPALPALCLLGGRTARRAPAWIWALCGLMLCVFPAAADILPAALADGLAAAWPPQGGFWQGALFAAALAAGAGAFGAKARPLAAAGLIAIGASVGYVYLKSSAFSDLDRAAGARELWREHRQIDSLCTESVRRHVEYGLRYYSDGKIAPCKLRPNPVKLVGDPPRLTASTPRN